MSKIIGVTVGTPLSPKSIKDKLKPVTSVNGVEPDDSGNVALATYNGEYQVTPSTKGDITLLTSQTFVNGDVKILKIPYAEVTNDSGGSTATIGGN